MASRNRSAPFCSSIAGGGAGDTGAKHPAQVRTRTSALLLALLLLIPRLHKELYRGPGSRHHRLIQTIRLDTLLDQVLLHGRPALLRIGVAFTRLFVRFDSHLLDLVVTTQNLRQLVEQP